MAHVIGYHRPSSLDEAWSLLTAPGTKRVILGGGTTVNAATDPDPVEVVDLQALGINTIDTADGRVVVGATATLADFAASNHVPGPLAELARREAPNTLRAVATVGGLLAVGDPESELLAGLLVHDASVAILDAEGTRDRTLSDVLGLGLGGGIITGLTFDPTGATAATGIGRTPGDRPIVAAVARKTESGEVRVAMCGVAMTPVLIEAVADLDPPADFRGSSGYRRHLAETLLERVRKEVA